MVYKNMSMCKKTFYGVTFLPGDIKQVSHYINDKDMIRLSDSELPKPNKPIKNVEKKGDE